MSKRKRKVSRGVYPSVLNNCSGIDALDKKDLEPIKMAVDTLLVNTNKLAMDVTSSKIAIGELKREMEAGFRMLMGSMKVIEQVTEGPNKLKEGETVCSWHYRGTVGIYRNIWFTGTCRKTVGILSEDSRKYSGGGLHSLMVFLTEQAG